MRERNAARALRKRAVWRHVVTVAHLANRWEREKVYAMSFIVTIIYLNATTAINVEAGPPNKFSQHQQVSIHFLLSLYRTGLAGDLQNVNHVSLDCGSNITFSTEMLSISNRNISRARVTSTLLIRCKISAHLAQRPNFGIDTLTWFDDHDREFRFQPGISRPI